MGMDLVFNRRLGWCSPLVQLPHARHPHHSGPNHLRLSLHARRQNPFQSDHQPRHRIGEGFVADCDNTGGFKTFKERMISKMYRDKNILTIIFLTISSTIENLIWGKDSRSKFTLQSVCFLSARTCSHSPAATGCNSFGLRFLKEIICSKSLFICCCFYRLPVGLSESCSTIPPIRLKRCPKRNDYREGRSFFRRHWPKSRERSKFFRTAPCNILYKCNGTIFDGDEIGRIKYLVSSINRKTT